MRPQRNFLIGCVRDPMMIVALLGWGVLLGVITLWRVALWVRHPAWRRRKANDCPVPDDSIGPLRLEAQRRSRANGPWQAPWSRTPDERWIKQAKISPDVRYADMRTLLLLLVVLALCASAYMASKLRDIRRRRRREIWQARREEQDRIWYDRMGKD